MTPNSYEILSTRVVVESPHGIALVQRAPTGEFQRGWELPGGKVDPGEDLFTAASRETWQEIGIVVNFASYNALPIEERIIPDGKHRGKVYRAFGFLATTESTNTELSDEHINIRWLTPEAALEIKTLTPTSHATISKLMPLLMS